VAAITLTNGKAWASQKAAKAHFKEILHTYANGAPVDDPGHHDDLAALVVRLDAVLPAEERKGTAGIVRFERRLNTGAGFATPGFWLVRPNGEATDFSYLTAIEGRAKSQDLEFADACRRAVAGELAAFMRAEFARSSNGVVACALTGARIAQAEAHVDHDDPSFASIILSFRQAQGWVGSVPAGVLTSGADAQTTTTFVRPADEAAFRAFHQAHAKLRVVSVAANLARAASQRRPAPIA
jgi:hypothetical protein